ncbi:MAG: tetratricopeptide repeat protein [Anaerolineae bacterium]
MSDDLRPTRDEGEEEETEEFESLFESFQREGKRARPAEPTVSSQEDRGGGLLGMLRSLTGRRKAGQKRRESVARAASPSFSEETEKVPAFTGLDELDIEAARESLLTGLEEEEGEEAVDSRKRKSHRGIAERLGLKRGQAVVLGLLLIMVLLVYVALGIIILRSRAQWAAVLPSPEPRLTSTTLPLGDVGGRTPSPSPAPAEDEASEEGKGAVTTPTVTPTATPRPAVTTRFDLQVMRNPTDLGLRLERGWEYLRLQAYEEAVSDFSYMIEQDPERAEAYLGLGQSYVFLRRWEEAEAALGTAISFAEDLEEAHFWLGQLLYLQGRYEEAMAEFDWAAEIHPENPRNEAWLARAAVRLQDLTEAQGAIERALALDDRYVLTYVAYAELETLEENYAEAQGHLLYARDLAPHDFEVLNALARLYVDHFPERWAEAEVLAQWALNWATWSVERARALHTLGRLRLAEGRYEEAREVLARASDLATVDGEVALPELAADFDRALAPQE